MSDPFEISVGDRNVGNDDIDHQYVITRSNERYDVLRRFLDFDSDMFGLVFTRTRRDSQKLAEELSRDGYSADAIHGDLNQGQRDRVMSSFRSRRLQILVATDVAARGIDVSDITHVFHYNIPEDLSFYTHRSGRTGRAGSKGISLVLAHPKDMGLLRLLEIKFKLRFTHAHIPTGREICERRLLHQIKELREVPPSKEIQDFLPSIYEELSDLTKEQVIERMSTMSFSSFLIKYRNAEDLNPNRRAKAKSGSIAGAVSVRRLFINVGTTDVNGKVGFLTLVSQAANIDRKSIGKVEMEKRHTFFEVEDGLAAQVIKHMDNSSYMGRSIRVNDHNQGRQKDDFKKKKHGGKKFKKVKRHK
jgi:ATP-dependent RNA helicase DeaD